ncbi:MAG: RagB/SusD family nutrient uptake outer membrane protein [Cyclobacteriaceae bacterium]
MKSIAKYSLYVFAWLAGLSCNGVLDTEDQTAIDGLSLFANKGLAEYSLNAQYQVVIPGFGMLANAGLSDDTPGGGFFGEMSGDVIDPVAGTNDTPGSYSIETFQYIRNINVFIDGVQNGSLSAEEKDELNGQAYFLRAFLYWDLVLYYGGVPIVDRILDINDGFESNLLPRASATECVDFITADLDRAIEMLQGKDLVYGRITAAAAAAFKGRVLLFYASPQFDPNGLTNADGVSARWQRAYEANREAKEIAEASGHALYPNYANIFLDEDNEEAIMITKFTFGLRVHGFENSVRPASVANAWSGSGAPTWDFVKAFPMKDGRSIEDSPMYDSLVYWKDRDPRFYATVCYNGTPWQFTERSGAYQWTYFGNEQEEGIIPSTGFYLRKNVDTEIGSTETVQTPTDWIEIRFAEVLLNLAESANEIGNIAEARNLIIQLRQRAGIEAGDGSYGINANDKLSMRATIMNERRIELSFENKRHFDLRRRNLFVNDLNGTQGNGLNNTRRTGIFTRVNTQKMVDIEPSIALNADPSLAALAFFEDNVRDTVDWTDDANLAEYFEYELQYEDDIENPIQYLQPKYNFFFLPTNAIVRNENLLQTIGWLDGTFDPLVD